MGEDLFKNLPDVITRTILASLPINTIINCWGVCKSWRDLIEGGDFAMMYALKPGLAFATKDGCCIVCDGEEFDPLVQFMIYEHRIIDLYPAIIDSVNGLLLILLRNDRSYFLSVCNPITSEYVVLPPLPSQLTYKCNYIFGFGVSKLSGKCKILCGDEYGLYVCNLGGEWRIISEAPPSRYIMFPDTTFLNGSLHWLARGFDNNHMICCFDLENEQFTHFYLPPRVYRNEEVGLREYRLFVLNDQLCVYDIVNSKCRIDWTMSVYGDDNSWVEENTWRTTVDLVELQINLKNWSKNFASRNFCEMLYICTRSRIFKSYYNIQQCIYSNVVLHTPSFYSLKAMGVRNVQLLKLGSSKFLEGSTLQSV